MNDSQKIYDTLYDKFPELRPVFDNVGVLDIAREMKQPYSALVGVIAGQKISFKQARQIRSFIYKTLNGNLSFTRDLLETHSDKLKILDCWPIIERLNAYLATKPSDYLDITNPTLVTNIRSLTEVKGIGPWTIESTLLTCLAVTDTNATDIFPVGDKFLQNVLVRLGLLQKPIKVTDVKTLTNKWIGYRGWITWYMWRHF